MFYNNTQAFPEELNSILTLHLIHRTKIPHVAAAEFAQDTEEADVLWQLSGFVLTRLAGGS